MRAGKTAPDTGSTVCPVCGNATRPAFLKYGYSIMHCAACGNRTTAGNFDGDHVSSVYDDTYFFGGGAGYDNYLTEADLLREQGRRYGSLIAEHAPFGRLLDVGCAAGFVQSGLEESGWSTTGLEPNISMVEYGQKTLGLNVMQGSLEDVQGLEPFDAICLIQVIGHFHDLAQAMRSVSDLTRPGGVCVIEYWRLDSWVARVLGKNWHEYSPPSVLHWFSRAGLDELMRRNAFSPVVSGKPKKYISSGHAASLVEYLLKSVPGGRFMTKPLRMLPSTAKLPYPAFDLEWRLYRRQ